MPEDHKTFQIDARYETWWCYDHEHDDCLNRLVVDDENDDDDDGSTEAGDGKDGMRA